MLLARCAGFSLSLRLCVVQHLCVLRGLDVKKLGLVAESDSCPTCLARLARPSSSDCPTFWLVRLLSDFFSKIVLI